MPRSFTVFGGFRARAQVTANLDESYAGIPGRSADGGDDDGGAASRALAGGSQAPAQLTVIGGSSHNLAATPHSATAGGEGHGGDSLGDGGLGANVVPALGNSWHHCVSTRLVLEQLTSAGRALTITKSPIAAQATCGFAITAAGLEEDYGPADLYSTSG